MDSDSVEREAAAVTLEAAADLIETVGWTKGTYVSVHPFTGQIDGFCSVGALREATDLGNYFGASHALMEHLRQTGQVDPLMETPLFTPEGVIAAWNDHIVHDGSEVIDTLKTVAKDLRNENTID